MPMTDATDSRKLEQFETRCRGRLLPISTNPPKPKYKLVRPAVCITALCSMVKNVAGRMRSIDNKRTTPRYCLRS